MCHQSWFPRPFFFFLFVLCVPISKGYSSHMCIRCTWYWEISGVHTDALFPRTMAACVCGSRGLRNSPKLEFQRNPFDLFHKIHSCEHALARARILVQYARDKLTGDIIMFLIGRRYYVENTINHVIIN